MNKKIFIIVLLVMEIGVNFDGGAGAPYILRADRQRTWISGWTV